MPSSTRAPLSACIVAFNEADRIAACLAVLAFCDEIVVVDSHSSDATRAIAAAHGARVIERDWPGRRGVAIATIEMNYVRQKVLKLWLLERGLPIGARDRAPRGTPV